MTTMTRTTMFLAALVPALALLTLATSPARADLIQFVTPGDFDVSVSDLTVEDFQEGRVTGANISGPISGENAVLDARGEVIFGVGDLAPGVVFDTVPGLSTRLNLRMREFGPGGDLALGSPASGQALTVTFTGGSTPVTAVALDLYHVFGPEAVLVEAFGLSSGAYLGGVSLVARGVFPTPLFLATTEGDAIGRLVLSAGVLPPSIGRVAFGTLVDGSRGISVTVPEPGSLVLCGGMMMGGVLGAVMLGLGRRGPRGRGAGGRRGSGNSSRSVA